VEDALSGRTGVADHEKSFGPKTTSLPEAVRNLRNLPMTSDMRVDFIYSNVMYSAVSHAIETITGSNLGDFLRTRIWNPLGMTRTFWTLKDALEAEASGAAKLSRGYAWDSATEKYIEEDLPDFPGVSGSGANISSVVDYAKWLRCMMTRSAPLSAAGHASVVQPRMVMSTPGNNPYPGPNLYALGWFVDSYRGERVIWHSGGWTGFGSVMAFLPDRQWGFAMMGNTSRTSNYVQVILYFKLLDQLLDTPLEKQVDWSARMKGVVEQRREAAKQSRERLYPSLPANPMPLSLPLKAYVGSYRHPGYGVMILSAQGKGLEADRLKLEIAMTVKLEHISGNFWLAYLYVKNRDPRDVEVVRAEFYLSANGTVEKLGIEFEPKMGGEKIWFVRE
jgi:CubicO group peptidase (beta-lactamase class C family)